MTSSVDVMHHYNFTVTPPKEIDFYDEGKWSFALTVSNGIMMGIDAEAWNLKPFSKPTLAQILDAFGKPHELWIKVSQHQIGPYTFHLDLFYPKIGILVTGKGNAKINRRNEERCRRFY
jgi:hypothetical protein